MTARETSNLNGARRNFNIKGRIALGTLSVTQRERR